jgi:Phosphodiester glycosidase
MAPGLLAVDGVTVRSARSQRQLVSVLSRGAFVAPVPWPRRRRSRYERHRVQLRGGVRTTLHVVTYDLAAITPRVVVLERAMPLVRWCHERGVRDAVVGGFFVRALSEPLGELWIAGRQAPSTPFDVPWGAVRACVQVDGDAVRMARRDALPLAPAGDLLQAGPLLVADGRSVVADGADPEGFSIGARQFDSDITDGRFPRAALARTGRRLLAVACDGRTHSDAGMTLPELAEALIALGAEEAINLDGGGSASLVHAGRLRNRPREAHGVDLLEGRSIVTAIVFDPRV